jgi:Na+-translocating ferredoxin:NAD+ oxidoreductase RnfD subunit
MSEVSTGIIEPPGPSPKPLPQLAHARPTLLHSGTGVSLFHAQHAIAAAFPLVAGLLLFGWRALLVLALVMGSNLLGTVAWRWVGRRGAQIYVGHSQWLAMLLAMMLPPHLAGRTEALWAIPVSAGLLLAILTWTLGGLGSGRIHPALVAFLLLIVVFGERIEPSLILQRHAVPLGDLLDAPEEPLTISPAEAWVRAPRVGTTDALRVAPAQERLWEFTTGSSQPDRSWLSLEGLLRDRLPPLEDMILGGHPRTIGTASGIGVIIGGLFLLYRGLIDYRIPLLIVVSAFASLLVLPIPVVITDIEPMWRWMIWRDPGVGWGLAITFVNYELLSSPLLFTAFFLATAPSLRPMHRRARTIYAILVGVTCAAMQLYTSVFYGPYLALLLVSLLSPILDAITRPRTLV